MARTISTSSTTLVTLSVLADNPTTITANADLKDALYVSYAGLGVLNAGTILSGTNRQAVYLETDSSLTNQTHGLISGSTQYGVGANSNPATVVNYGTILGPQSNGAGIGMGDGGSVTNLSGGTISGDGGIVGQNVALTVTNAGTIIGSGGSGVDLYAGGSVTNRSGGSITGYFGVYAKNAGSWTVTNAGTITGTGVNSGAGVKVDGASGLVDNLGSGLISGYFGLRSYDFTTVINAGRIDSTSNQAALRLQAGGYVYNQLGGTISGSAGISARPDNTALAALTVVNAGVIAPDAGGLGVAMYAGGTITNLAGATIAGYHAILSEQFSDTSPDDPATVVNAGTLLSLGESATVQLLTGGMVTNQSQGVIGSATAGQGVDGQQAMTVVNAGTIAGSSYAVQFDSGVTNRLVVDPGAVFLGSVYGANAIGATAASTLELAGATAGTFSGAGYQFTDFTQTTIDAGADWTLTGSNNFAAGTTLSNAGTLAILDTALSDTAKVVNSGTLLVDQSTLSLTSLTGTGTVTLDAGTFGVTGSIATTETIDFAAPGSELTTNRLSFANPIDNFVQGDTIELTAVTDGKTVTLVNTDTLQITRTGQTAIDLIVHDSAAHANDVFAISDTGAITDETPCFLRGTGIRTETGETPVEDLAIGGRVLTLNGHVRPITWIGTGRVLVSPGRRSAATPVIVRKGALADNVPHRDLRITKGHALFVDGVLVPVEFLVNHRSILWDDHQREVEFYHIELETHGVLIANGAPSESYRDDGNRWLFRNANSGWSQPPKPPIAPVLTGGAVVDAIWRRLLDRTGSRPGVPLTEDPDLHLLVGGSRHDATTQASGIHIFGLPATPNPVRIISRACVPQELGLARDPRSLGVALRRIVVRQGTRFRVMQAADVRLADGFHAFEAGNGLRWTDGDAILPAALFEGFDGAVEVVLHLGGSMRYPAFAEAAGRVAA